jgi:penicillin G amidase
LTDLSDVFHEEISSNTYKVDGELRQLIVVKDPIKVKNYENPLDFEIRLTHRGPLIDYQLLKGAEAIFLKGIPMQDDGSSYSLAWAGSIEEDLTTDILRAIIDVTTVQEFFAIVDSNEIFASVSQNLVFAFANGDIAYILCANLPIRKNLKPYAGCRVHDGTKSDNDWIGFVKPKDLPRIVNPKKGFIVTANNR